MLHKSQCFQRPWVCFLVDLTHLHTFCVSGPGAATGVVPCHGACSLPSKRAPGDVIRMSGLPHSPCRTRTRLDTPCGARCQAKLRALRCTQSGTRCQGSAGAVLDRAVASGPCGFDARPGASIQQSVVSSQWPLYQPRINCQSSMICNQ